MFPENLRFGQVGHVFFFGNVQSDKDEHKDIEQLLNDSTEYVYTKRQKSQYKNAISSQNAEGVQDDQLLQIAGNENMKTLLQDPNFERFPMVLLFLTFC